MAGSCGFWGVLAATALFTAKLNASGITYQFDTPFPTDPSPAVPAPGITVDFENVSGGVSLIISAVGLTGSEFASEMYFNLDPNERLLDLEIP